MSARLLAVDAGNTHTTLGLFDSDTLLGHWRIATRVPRTGDELWVMLLQFLRNGGIEETSLAAVSISSVVPELTYAYTRMAVDRLRVSPLVISAENVNMLRIDYNPPSSVGADRLCGAVAAYVKYGGPIVIVDVGTATVFDVISRDATYLGGIIAPGIQTAIESLHGKAALLPRVEVVFPPSVIGRNTETAIQSGVLLGSSIIIEGMIERIEQEMKEKVKVVATGGLAEVVKSKCRRLETIEPHLVLEGIRLITDQQ